MDKKKTRRKTPNITDNNSIDGGSATSPQYIVFSDWFKLIHSIKRRNIRETLDLIAKGDINLSNQSPSTKRCIRRKLGVYRILYRYDGQVIYKYKTCKSMACPICKFNRRAWTFIKAIELDRTCSFKRVIKKKKIYEQTLRRLRKYHLGGFTFKDMERDRYYIVVSRKGKSGIKPSYHLAMKLFELVKLTKRLDLWGDTSELNPAIEPEIERLLREYIFGEEVNNGPSGALGGGGDHRPAPIIFVSNTKDAEKFLKQGAQVFRKSPAELQDYIARWQDRDFQDITNLLDADEAHTLVNEDTGEKKPLTFKAHNTKRPWLRRASGDCHGSPVHHRTAGPKIRIS